MFHVGTKYSGILFNTVYKGLQKLIRFIFYILFRGYVHVYLIYYVQRLFDSVTEFLNGITDDEIMNLRGFVVIQQTNTDIMYKPGYMVYRYNETWEGNIIIIKAKQSMEDPKL